MVFNISNAEACLSEFWVIVLYPLSTVVALQPVELNANNTTARQFIILDNIFFIISSFVNYSSLQ